MKISFNNISFGWNIYTHMAETKKALDGFNCLSAKEKDMLGHISQLPDLEKESTQDFGSAHFFDVLNKDPSFGTKNDEINNAMSRFLAHSEKALQETKREDFLREIGYAAHYLQDAATPPHVENGNYLHKLYRLPMHLMFERGTKHGAKGKTDSILKNYIPTDTSFVSLKQLFHDTANFAVQKENKVEYNNIKKWFGIQQKCIYRSVDATRSYFDYMLKFLPKNTQAKTICAKVRI